MHLRVKRSGLRGAVLTAKEAEMGQRVRKPALYPTELRGQTETQTLPHVSVSDARVLTASVRALAAEVTSGRVTLDQAMRLVAWGEL